MSNATEQARSTRGDARPFADALSSADDAFTFGSAGESRTLTLAELETVLELDAPVELPVERSAPVSAQPTDTALLTLVELSDALLSRPAVDADALDFDFGTGTDERARRRTAARWELAEAPQLTSGTRGAGPSTRGDDVAAPSGSVPPVGRDASAVRRETQPLRRDVPAGRLAAPVARHAAALAVPLAAPPAARRRLQPQVAAPVRDRRPLPGSGIVQRFREEPDRIALYAVLLGILLVLIAASSSSASAVALLSLHLP